MPTLGRLTRRPEFLRVAAAKRKSAMPGMVVQARVRCERSQTGSEDGDGGPGRHIRFDDPENQVRVGLTVSRKVGNAVARNRARRRLRALAREVLPQEGSAGVDYVLIGRKATLARPYGDLRQDLRRALRKLAPAPPRDAPPGAKPTAPDSGASDLGTGDSGRSDLGRSDLGRSDLGASSARESG